MNVQSKASKKQKFINDKTTLFKVPLEGDLGG
jgi:hypothetical protein